MEDLNGEEYNFSRAEQMQLLLEDTESDSESSQLGGCNKRTQTKSKVNFSKLTEEEKI